MIAWYIVIFLLIAYISGYFDNPPEIKANNATKAYTDKANEAIKFQQSLFYKYYTSH